MVQEFLKSISIVFYEALCCIMFLNIFLKQKYSSKRIKVTSVLLMTILFMICALTTYSDSQYIFRSMEITGCIYVVSIIFYAGKWLMKIFLSAAFYAILFCVDYLGLIIVEQLLEPALLSNHVIQVIAVLLCKTVLFLFVLLLNYFWEKEKSIHMKNTEWILIICFPVLTVAIMLVMLLSFQQKDNSTGYLTVAFGIGIMNLIMFGMLKVVSEREIRLNEMKVLHERNKERMQAYYEISADYQNKQSMLHDYSNQVHCIQGLLKDKKYEEAEQYAKKLTGIIQDGLAAVDVHNPVINVVLNQKYRLAKSKGISILFHINELSGVWMEEQDIVILLSNLLDNAIEACDKLDTSRIIRLKLIKEKKQLVLSVQNPVASPVVIDNDEIRTGKKDKKNHGIGLKNVQMVIDKYQGMHMMRCEDGWFYYTVVIPKKDAEN